MKMVVAVVSVLLLTAGLCWAGGYEAKGKAGAYTRSLRRSIGRGP